MLKISSMEPGTVTIYCTSINSKNKLENTEAIRYSHFFSRTDLTFQKIQKNSKALELLIGILGNVNKPNSKPQTWFHEKPWEMGMRVHPDKTFQQLKFLTPPQKENTYSMVTCYLSWQPEQHRFWLKYVRANCNCIIALLTLWFVPAVDVVIKSVLMH